MVNRHAPLTTLAACSCLLLAACSSSTYLERDAERDQRKVTEVSKAMSQAELVCVDGSDAIAYLLLFYCPWDRTEYNPVPMAPLERDFLKTFVTASGRFEAAPAVRDGLTGPTNDLLNQRLPAIADGTVNAVFARIDAGSHVGVAPYDATSVLVWIPEVVKELKPEDEAAATKPKELVWRVDLRGNPLAGVDNTDKGALAQPAPYHPTLTWPSRADRFYTGPGQAAAFWTYAAWPPRITTAQVQVCKPIEGDILRH